jgi:hypothetical protein
MLRENITRNVKRYFYLRVSRIIILLDYYTTMTSFYHIRAKQSADTQPYCTLSYCTLIYCFETGLFAISKQSNKSQNGRRELFNLIFCFSHFFSPCGLRKILTKLVNCQAVLHVKPFNKLYLCSNDYTMITIDIYTDTAI